MNTFFDWVRSIIITVFGVIIGVVIGNLVGQYYTTEDLEKTNAIPMVSNLPSDFEKLRQDCREFFKSEIEKNSKDRGVQCDSDSKLICLDPNKEY